VLGSGSRHRDPVGHVSSKHLVLHLHLVRRQEEAALVVEDARSHSHRLGCSSPACSSARILLAVLTEADATSHRHWCRALCTAIPRIATDIAICIRTYTDIMSAHDELALTLRWSCLDIFASVDRRQSAMPTVVRVM